MQTMHLVQAAHWRVPNVISSLHDTEAGAKIAALILANRMRQELMMPLMTGSYEAAMADVAKIVERDGLGCAPWVEVTPLAVVTEKPVEAPPAVAHLTLTPEGASVLGHALGALTARLDTDWEDQVSGERDRLYDRTEGEAIRAIIRHERELVDQCRAILARPVLGRVIDLTVPPSDPRKLGPHTPSPVDLAKTAGFGVRMFGVVFHVQYPNGQATRGGYTTEAEAWESAGRAAVRMANGATMQDELPHAYRTA